MSDRTTPWPLAVVLACIMMAGGWWLGIPEFLQGDSKPKQATEAPVATAPKPKPAPPELTEEQKAEAGVKKAKTDAENAQFERDFAALRQLKSSMKNPGSFDLEEANRMDDGSICVSYRATNSFNAVMPGSAVITKTQIITAEHKLFRGEWNKRCANKSGKSIRGLRWFL